MTTHIKINNVPPKIQYTADGTQTVFEFPFVIFDTDNIQIYIGSTKQNASTYTVTKTNEGGSVTFNTAPEQGKVITIRRELDIERTSDFQEGGALRADVLNDELDYQIACQQQIAEALNRTMVFPPYIEETGLDLTLPLPEHGKAIVWNADGTNLENSTVEINALESTLRDYKNVAEAEAAVACEKAATASSKATVATNAAQQAAEKATEVAAAVEGFAHAHSNCITGIPQDIKLELNDGVISLKSGSIVTKPNGTQLQISVDKTVTISIDGTYFILPTGAGGSIGAYPVSNFCSGSTDSLSGVANHIWFDTTNLVINKYGSDGTTVSWEACFPVAVVTVSNGTISSIDKVFNGAGYIGHHAFVLPGISVLVGNGKNADGTLSSAAYTKTNLTVIELDTTRKAITMLSSTGAERNTDFITVKTYNDLSTNIGQTVQYVIDENKSYRLTSSTPHVIAEAKRTLLVRLNYDGTSFTQFDIEPVRRIATQRELDTKAGLQDNNTFTGINTVPTQETTDKSQKIANTAYVKNAIELAGFEPRDVTTLWGTGSPQTPSSVTLSESFINFEKIGLYMITGSGDVTNVYVQDTYWLNRVLGQTSHDVLLGQIGNDMWTIKNYNASSNPSTTTVFKTGNENAKIVYIYGINRKSL